MENDKELLPGGYNTTLVDDLYIDLMTPSKEGWTEFRLRNELDMANKTIENQLDVIVGKDCLLVALTEENQKLRGDRAGAVIAFVVVFVLLVIEGSRHL